MPFGKSLKLLKAAITLHFADYKFVPDSTNIEG